MWKTTGLIVMAAIERKTSYFIAKCDSIASLRKCIDTSRWACRNRKVPPHPSELLTNAQAISDHVIIIFSVNNCHGWHGYAEMVSDVETNGRTNCSSDRTNTKCDSKTIHSSETMENKQLREEKTTDWKFFDVKWKKHFLNDFGERCLRSKDTDNEQYILTDGTPLNKARNWQEVPCDIGRSLCILIDNFYEELKTKQQEKMKMIEENIPPAFFHSSDEVDLMNENWLKISVKITKELGNIIMACPFGSRRYNLHTSTSDMDMFLVYQAKTRDILGFNPPKQTLKSNERESCDFTIHEIFRFGELLMSGDHRCVETLFVAEDTLVHTSPAFQHLQQHKHLFVNRNCLDKYLRDACGSKGTKQLQRMTDGHSPTEALSDRMSKLAYIIIRLLQNAADIVRGGPIIVYRPEVSAERVMLMKIRQGTPSIGETWNEINRLLSYVEEYKAGVPDHTDDMTTFLEAWLIQLRREQFS
ncbi:uncharacterized protein LOC110446857 isoform X2 [Mizuhopecten yessoensis]|uniref:uncharacterized protein LOC110446857 isoform X2 n=1 Tax=Mizuhopecten yessoensis TaxID=6573 RepID=UPI000B45858B|nr:uncharacterized protein LOC110446857 isoform X2 [Mizuhopecten yessoensis]XP_021347859.1 uncharacterized protein LOC110446857 isoform X2 [Mizuhopecten yessoensis]